MTRKGSKSLLCRRRPVQNRARVTVEAILDAAVKLLKRSGAASITTNQVADTAGVSIGSVYQYFPNKHALFIALHERHISQVDAAVRRTIRERSDASLERLVRALVDGMVETHASDPELAELLQSEVPHRAGSTVEFAVRLADAFQTALAPHAKILSRRTDLPTRAFVMASLVEALGHAIVLRRPKGLSLERARRECCRAILAYLRT